MSFSRVLPRTRFAFSAKKLQDVNDGLWGLSVLPGGEAKRAGEAKRVGVRFFSTEPQSIEDVVLRDEEDKEMRSKRKFLPLKIKPDPEVLRTRKEKIDLTPLPRSVKMDPDQDWTNVWPTGATFRHSVAPFPLRMGVSANSSENDGISPDKSVNVELLKISNFLHLTPGHVEKHCRALQPFCSDWPEGLDTEEDFDRHFPVEVTTQDFVYSWSLRDERAKINTVKVKVSSLHLDEHGRDKLVRLAEGRLTHAPDPEEEALKQTQIGIEGDTPMNLRKEAFTAVRNITHLNERGADGKWRRRYAYGWWDWKKHWLHPEVHALQEDLPPKTPIADYDFETDTLVLTTQQCPTRKQNYDHAMFLLKALYGESIKVESWESSKTPEDSERFIWDKSGQKEVGLRLFRASRPDVEGQSEAELLASPEVDAYRRAVEELVNYGETPERMGKYKEAVKSLLAIPKEEGKKDEKGENNDIDEKNNNESNSVEENNNYDVADKEEDKKRKKKQKKICADELTAKVVGSDDVTERDTVGAATGAAADVANAEGMAEHAEGMAEHAEGAVSDSLEVGVDAVGSEQTGSDASERGDERGS